MAWAGLDASILNVAQGEEVFTLATWKALEDTFALPQEDISPRIFS